MISYCETFPCLTLYLMILMVSFEYVSDISTLSPRVSKSLNRYETGGTRMEGGDDNEVPATAKCKW